MSDDQLSAPLPESTSTDAMEAVQRMQNLTDIEGGLADAALAAVSTEQHAPDAQTVQTLESAEVIEQALEQSMPADPPNTGTVSESLSAAQMTDNASLALGAEHSSATAQSASDAINALQADLNEPILPDGVAASTHDAPMETALEEASGQVVVQVTSPTPADPPGLPTSTDSDVHLSRSPVVNGNSAEVSHDAGPSTQPSTASAQQTPYMPLNTSSQSLLPMGLTETSPSVRFNPDVVRKWRDREAMTAYERRADAPDPHDSHVVYGLFSWCVGRSEVIDARAWYEALATDDPSAVSQGSQQCC